MRPSPPNSAVKRLSIVLPKSWPNPEPEGVVPGSQLIPLQNNHPAFSLQPLHFMGAGDFGTETPCPPFLWLSPGCATWGQGCRSEAVEAMLFNSTLLQPCGVLAGGGVSAGAGWAAAHVRWDPDRTAATALSCLALGLSDSQP